MPPRCRRRLRAEGAGPSRPSKDRDSPSPPERSQPVRSGYRKTTAGARPRSRTPPDPAEGAERKRPTREGSPGRPGVPVNPAAPLRRQPGRPNEGRAHQLANALRKIGDAQPDDDGDQRDQVLQLRPPPVRTYSGSDLLQLGHVLHGEVGRDIQQPRRVAIRRVLPVDQLPDRPAVS
jgi:hypothetical protein